MINDAGVGTSLLGLGVALPGPAIPQTRVVEFLAKVADAEDSADRFGDVVRRIGARTGIERRHSVLSDFDADTPDRFAFFPQNWGLEPFPTTAARMAAYEREAPPLAERAVREALTDAHVAPKDVSHLVLTTCTGFFAPGPDVQLCRMLGLRPDVQRTIIGFMGCYAGFNGIRTAHQIVQSDPSAVVLVVSVELCTLHLQKTRDLATAVSNVLFADGAAAAVFGSAHRAGRPTLRATRSEVAHDTQGEMSWRIGDHGFIMHLAPSVPEHLRAKAVGFVDRLTRGRAEHTRFAVHPGGRKILDVISDELGSSIEESYGVLRDHGNMSSASIFFVLQRMLRRPEPFVALGFGPGLTMEGLAFEV